MANRDKKLALNRKQSSASPVPPKEIIAGSDSSNKLNSSKTDLQQSENPIPKVSSKSNNTKSLSTNKNAGYTKQISKTVGKRLLGKTLSTTLKARDKKAIKIKQHLVKALLNNAKNSLETTQKNVLLKNGIKPKKVYRKRAQAGTQNAQIDNNDGPPILEPIMPIQQSIEKKVKKRVKRNTANTSDGTKKTKIEQNSYLSSIDETIDSILNQFTLEDIEVNDRKVVKKTRVRKPKIENVRDTVADTIEEVMNDLSYLIKSKDIKQEPITISDNTKIEIPKPKKRVTKKKTSIKKEVVNTDLKKEITLDASAKHLIDMLDLSVGKSNQLSVPVRTRRHSIENFPVGASTNIDSQSTVTKVSSLPKTVASRGRRVSKLRQSIDVVRRHSPYSTRFDTPTLILRNGKHRKIKNNLLEGIDFTHRKRKRLCSDFSGSEKSVSKLSGYESDSSFSDLVSLQPTDNLDIRETSIKPEFIKKEIDIQLPPQNEVETKSDNLQSDNMKRSLSMDNLQLELSEEIKNDNFRDSNSNLCNEIKLELLETNQNMEGAEFENSNSDASELPDKNGVQVPVKSIILDIMKQTFNDANSAEQDKRTTRSSTKKGENSEDESSKDETFTVNASSELSNTLNDITEDNNLTANNEFVDDLMRLEDISSSEITDNLEIDKVDAQLDDVITNCDTDVLQSENIDVENLDTKQENEMEVNETPENLAIKENILQALGLQSLKAAEEAKTKGRTIKNDYTGTLKTVIKLNRSDKKKGRGAVKMTLHKNKNKVIKENNSELIDVLDESDLKNAKEIGTITWRSSSHTAQSSDTAGALRKSHYYNRSNNLDGSSEHTSDGDTTNADGDDSGKILVIPEKASSFSIHPGRLCKDECTYCFGKFGLFDTPCHIAQIKSADRQKKILKSEKHLTRDSCLCDACYRHVDRKLNGPSISNKPNKRNAIIVPGPRQNHCHVLGCNNAASNILRRKWLTKMRKSVCSVINVDIDNPGLHSFPVCSEHYQAVEHLLVCAMCKRRLARNHIHYLGSETIELNAALNAEGIAVKLVDKPAVCKLCRYFSTIYLKSPDEQSEETIDFIKRYKERLLYYLDVNMGDDIKEEPNSLEKKDRIEKKTISKKRKKKLHKSLNVGPPILEPQIEVEKIEQTQMTSDSNSTSKSRSESPSDYMVDYNTLIPSIAMECGSDTDNFRHNASVLKNSFKSEPVKKDNIGTLNSKAVKLKSGCSNDLKNNPNVVQQLGSNPSISVRQLFPGEEELGLHCNIDFGNVKEKLPEGWEKCMSTIQYDSDTKLLWQELQKPYGNQSSFLRHLILLEKYFRSGDLILSPNASHHSVNYSESVQNRLRAYDNIPISSYNFQSNPTTVNKSSSGIITTKEAAPSVSIINAANIPKNTPITLSQINNFAPHTVNKNRNPGVPPGLISLLPGSSRPSTKTVIKVPQPQKIKIPLIKNWRPNLIPIDPNKKFDKDKKPGFVKVISAGKPYHITIDDYNRMCAIKKSYDLKQKRLQESQIIPTPSPTATIQTGTIYRTIAPKTGFVLSKNSAIISPKNISSDAIDTESNVEKLDRTVEELTSKLVESPSIIPLPKIPKSLTVIPQTVKQHQISTNSTVLNTTKPKSTSKS